MFLGQGTQMCVGSGPVLLDHRLTTADSVCGWDAVVNQPVYTNATGCMAFYVHLINLRLCRFILTRKSRYGSPLSLTSTCLCSMHALYDWSQSLPHEIYILLSIGHSKMTILPSFGSSALQKNKSLRLETINSNFYINLISSFWFVAMFLMSTDQFVDSS